MSTSKEAQLLIDKIKPILEKSSIPVALMVSLVLCKVTLKASMDAENAPSEVIAIKDSVSWLLDKLILADRQIEAEKQ